MFLVSVEKEFNLSVGQDLLDILKARFMKHFKADVIKKAPVLSLNIEFRETLKAIYVMLISIQMHYSVNNIDRIDAAMHAVDNLKQAQNENLEKLLDRDAKIDPLFEKLELMNQFEDFRPSYKKTEGSQMTLPISDKQTAKSGDPERPKSTNKPQPKTGGLSKQAKFLILASALVGSGLSKVVVFAVVAFSVCGFTFEKCGSD